MLKVVSSEDEDDLFSSDEEGEHHVLNLFLDVVEQSNLGMLVENFPLRRGNCKDSSVLSSGDGSPVPRDASCLVV